MNAEIDKIINQLEYWAELPEEIPDHQYHLLLGKTKSLARAMQITRMEAVGLPILIDEQDAKLWQDYCAEMDGCADPIGWIEYRAKHRRN